MLRQFPIAFRIVLVVVIMTLLGLSVGFGFYSVIRKIEVQSTAGIHDAMLTGHKNKIRVATHSLATTLSEALKNAATDDERLELLRRLTANVRFEEDSSGYFFTYEGTVALSVPAKRTVEGKDLSGAKDSNGVFYVRELAAAASRGGDFVEYIFAKPDKGDQPKLAYAEAIPGTKYWIGTGVYIDNIAEERTRFAATIQQEVASRTTNVAIVSSLVLLVVLAVSIAIVRSIVVPLRSATAAATSIAGGELSVNLDVSGRDEAAALQQALQRMVATLGSNIEEISNQTHAAEEKARAAQLATREAEEARLQAEHAKKDGMHQAALRLEEIVTGLASGAQSIADKANAIKTGSSRQKEQIDSTAVAMEEMNSTVLEVARNASYAAKAGQEASQKAREGAEVVRLSMEAMRKTQNQTESLRTNMAALDKQAQDIGQIMSVISDIADQTNLLALNAAIEAARAGDAGRGFAVVADEVRKLAEKTMGATKEVGNAITSIQRVATDNINSVTAAVADLDVAGQHSARSGDVLQEIVSEAEDSAQQIREIATAAEEQSATSEEINSAIESISQITQTTALDIEQTTSTLQHIARQTQQLQALVDELKSEDA